MCLNIYTKEIEVSLKVVIKRDQKVVKNCNVKLDKTWLVIFSKTHKM